MMKAAAKRRRSKRQIQDDKDNALQKEREIQQKLAAWDQMERALQQSEMERQQLLQKTEHVQAMFDQGVMKMNAHGQYEPVMDPNE